MKQRVAISQVKAGDVDGAVRQAIGLAGGLEELIKSDSRVVVKPNLCQPKPSGTGVVTDARVTEAVTRMVLEMRPASVVIAEGSIASYDGESVSTEECFEVSGTADVARRLGVETRYLNSDAVAEVAVPRPLVMDRVKVARTMLDCDVIVSIPVLKSHIRANATISLKNMWGIQPGAAKREGHGLGLDLAIIDLLSVLRPAYAVIDAILALEGLWRYPQDARRMDLVIAGRDPLAADIVGCSLMGMPVARVRHLDYLTRQEGAVSGLEQIEVLGEPLGKHRQQFKTAFEAYLEGFPGVRVLQGGSFCSGCVHEIVTALRHIKNAGYERDMEGLSILVGNPSQPPAAAKTAVLGSCSEGLAGLGAYAAGCAPTEDATIQALCEACGADPERVRAGRDETRRRWWESTAALLLR